MRIFTEAALAHLQTARRLARLATVGPDGTPHVTPVGWSLNTTDQVIEVGGIDLAHTKKVRDVARTRRAAIVIDDVLPPWQPRGIEIRGRADAITDPAPRRRIYPERIIGWGLDGRHTARAIREEGRQMYARLITIEVAPERFDEGIATVTSRVLRPVQAAPGFAGAYGFGARAMGLAVAVVFFDAEENLHASHDQSERLRNAATNLVGAHLTGVEEYEVVAATGQAVSRTAQFCRSLAWQEDPQRIEQAIRRITEGVMPGVRQNAGFQGGFWLADRTTGRCVGFTLWDRAENLQSSGAVGRQVREGPRRRGEMQVLGVQEYEVVARAATS